MKALDWMVKTLDGECNLIRLSFKHNESSKLNVIVAPGIIQILWATEIYVTLDSWIIGGGHIYG